jgi:hypothetical protein
MSLSENTKTSDSWKKLSEAGTIISSAFLLFDRDYLDKKIGRSGRTVAAITAISIAALSLFALFKSKSGRKNPVSDIPPEPMQIERNDLVYSDVNREAKDSISWQSKINSHQEKSNLTERNYL